MDLFLLSVCCLIINKNPQRMRKDDFRNWCSQWVQLPIKSFAWFPSRGQLMNYHPPPKGSKVTKVSWKMAVHCMAGGNLPGGGTHRISRSLITEGPWLGRFPSNCCLSPPTPPKGDSVPNGSHSWCHAEKPSEKGIFCPVMVHIIILITLSPFLEVSQAKQNDFS